VPFEELFRRPVTAAFDVPNASSDGGAVLLKAADRRLGLLGHMSAALVNVEFPVVGGQLPAS